MKIVKVLIANRGAIATRIIRTLDRLGIASVAVYAECDANSLHVSQADEAYCLGAGAATDTYLNIDRIIAIAIDSGADAIHPGYGFLSENADFVARCERAGINFIGPRSEQITAFGLKHRARELAASAAVPLLPGSDLLQDLGAALAAASGIGYPVMLKSTAGGGGIGIQLCHNEAELRSHFESIKQLSANNFADDGVFVEKYIASARHIEVQILGDGQGKALALGERDCSSQRRNQKVIEECPAPNLDSNIRLTMQRTAERLLASVAYRNAGTVEFILDTSDKSFYFLEVNTRLQVEHGVTEEVYGIDIVDWMLRIASAEELDLDALAKTLEPSGHAIQLRLYAEDPYKNFQPCPGLLTHVSFPSGPGIRVDHWIEAGIDIPPLFDPMLAKLIVKAETREKALTALRDAVAETQLYGSETNLQYLAALLEDPVLAAGEVTTRYLNNFNFQPCRIDVLSSGTQTTVQDFPGRQGLWQVGVPPSGPFDKLSFQLANRLLDNPEDAAGLEITMQGPSLRFSCDTQVAVCGANIDCDVDGQPVAQHMVVDIQAGQTLTLGSIKTAGARAYLCLRGGLQCPPYLNSRATFALGQFGGHAGRALRSGDVLPILALKSRCQTNKLPHDLLPVIARHWTIATIYGPHGAPDFFQEQDIETFFATDWEVHYNSSRTGIRLIGPKPLWARKDGGEAGLHPSNIHDNAYAFGSIDFTGDMPVILGPDGPSLGGFVCPATVIEAELWKLGQLRAGDTVRFEAIDHDSANQREAKQRQMIATLQPHRQETYQSAGINDNAARTNQDVNNSISTKGTHSVSHSTSLSGGNPDINSTLSPGQKTTEAIIGRLAASELGVDICYRSAGDHFLLVEYGPMVLDIALRLRAHALMLWLEENPLPGIRELTPGIRSLQVHYDSQRLKRSDLLEHLQQAEYAIQGSIQQLSVDSRTIYLPLSWDDEVCQQAIERYTQTVRQDAPWCPSNLEFIRRINGLDSIEQVRDIVFSAEYLVMGLGDVYLGAPVATPLDPRHRLVTTKYNPARTWTAENSVGIGGSYLCIYGMEGPGGYQFVGRTLQMWNRYRQGPHFEKPWLLRFFDRIRFYPVSHEELLDIRRDFPMGRYPLRVDSKPFVLNEYQQFLSANQHSIERFETKRAEAFNRELADWHATGKFHFSANEANSVTSEGSWPEHCTVIESPVAGSVWRVEVEAGQRVERGDSLIVLESMKMEIPVEASCCGQISQVLIKPGQQADAGQALVLIQDDPEPNQSPRQT